MSQVCVRATPSTASGVFDPSLLCDWLAEDLTALPYTGTPGVTFKCTSEYDDQLIMVRLWVGMSTVQG